MLVSADATWAISGAMYWSVIETNVGILAASIPSWKVLAKKYMPRLLGTSGGRSGHQKSKSSGFRLSSLNKNHTNSKVERHSRIAAKPARLDTQESDAGLRFEDGPPSPFVTHVGKRETALDDASSDEEALFTPQGRIGVKTEIRMQFEPHAR